MTFLPYKLAEPSKCFHFALGQTKNVTGFVYYLGIPDIIQTMMECSLQLDKDSVLAHLLDSKATVDLAALLKKNHWAADVISALDAVIQRDRSAIPMFASSVVAQTLAFFAFGHNSVPMLENKSTSFLLLTLRTDSLLGGAAPFTNPLGSFWLADVQSLLSLLQAGKASLTVEPFYMSVSHTQSKRQTHAEVRAETKAFGMQKRKAMLEECVSFLASDLERKRAQLKQIISKLDEQQPAGKPAEEAPKPPTDSVMPTLAAN